MNLFPEPVFANYNYKRVTRYNGKQTRILRHASSLRRHPSLEAKRGDCAKVHMDDRDRSEMEKRVEAQFATLIANGIRHVVLSAFGCGAFKNDPSDIAWVYKQAVERHRASFTVIAFAIFYAGHGQDNYKIFKSFLAPED